MVSLDTNILYYATNADCAEHGQAVKIYLKMLDSASSWIIADQVLMEYYKLIRNPVVLENPLSAPEAFERVDVIRNRYGCLHCSFESQHWSTVVEWLKRPGFPHTRVFDLVLAVTLRANGVESFYTRNVRDFEPFGFFEVIDPIETTPANGS